MRRPARDWLAAHGLLFPLVAANRRFLRRVVRRGTAVCIEGFPRSANSYAFLAFRRWNPGVRVGHHLHSPVQVKRAVSLGVPCAVLIRPPLDVVASVLVMDRGRISDTAAYRSYLQFYTRALPFRERVVVAPFAEVTRDPAAMVERINASFGTSFAAEPMTAAASRELMTRMERTQTERGRAVTSLTVPSDEKERGKAELRERLATHPLLPEAERLYAEWVGGRS